MRPVHNQQMMRMDQRLILAMETPMGAVMTELIGQTMILVWVLHQILVMGFLTRAGFKKSINYLCLSLYEKMIETHLRGSLYQFYDVCN